MGLTNRLQVEREYIPHEPGEWVDIRPLSWRALERAERVAQVRATEIARGMDAQTIIALRDERRNDTTDTTERERADQYDRGTVLEAAVKAWSYDAPVDMENINSLDRQTAEWIFDAAMAKTFRDEQEGEASGVSSSPITGA